MLTTGKITQYYSQATEKTLESFNEYSISKFKSRQTNMRVLLHYKSEVNWSLEGKKRVIFNSWALILQEKEIDSI